MPLNQSDLNPSFLLKHKHLATILPNLQRKIPEVNYQRSTLETPDNDFIDIDKSKVGSNKLVFVLHGLEGNSERQYAKGMTRIFNRNGYDAIVMNHRGCSGKPNILPTSYHSGKTDDLHFVFEQVSSQYEEVVIIGFSLSGNMLLKYLGDGVYPISPKIRKAVAISAPISLRDSAIGLAKPSNWIYMRRFLKTLKAKAHQKRLEFPTLNYTAEQVEACKDFVDIDNLYTAPVHGFKDAEDYWVKCSSKQFLTYIKTPTLIINALDDPFLGSNCFPFDEANSNPMLTLLAPKHGGHVGFAETLNFKNDLWSEKMALEFAVS